MALEHPSSAAETEKCLGAYPTIDAIRKKESELKDPWLECMWEVKGNQKVE